NLVISTTEQHAALPYQGSAHRQARKDRSWLSFLYARESSVAITAAVSMAWLLIIRQRQHRDSTITTVEVAAPLGHLQNHLVHPVERARLLGCFDLVHVNA